jgi:hypothetical protein
MSELDNGRMQRIIDHLWEAQQRERSLRVYALIDAARDRRIYPRLKSVELEWHCLFDQAVPELLARSSPHLVRLEPDAPFTRFMLQEGFGENWNIFFTSIMPVTRLLTHFRALWQTVDEQGRPAYFRFYDPRVFRVYMPTVRDLPNLRTVFGPVSRYFVESEDGVALIEFGRNVGLLTSRELALAGPSGEHPGEEDA